MANKKMKKVLAGFLALCLCMSLAAPTALGAEEGLLPPAETPENTENAEPVEVSGTVSVPGTDGTDLTVEVTVTTQQQPDGTVDVTLQTAPGGSETEGGLTVTYQSQQTLDEEQEVVEEQTSYTVTDSEDALVAEGGTQITTEVREAGPEDELTLSVQLGDENGEPVAEPSEEAPLTAADSIGGSSTPPQPTEEGDAVLAEDPADFDQTSVETAPRAGQLAITRIDVSSGSGVRGRKRP